MILVKSLHCCYPDMIQADLQVLFGQHLVGSPCEEEHMHWGSHVEVVVYETYVKTPKRNTIRCSNSSLLVVYYDTQ